MDIDGEHIIATSHNIQNTHILLDTIHAL